MEKKAGQFTVGEPVEIAGDVVRGKAGRKGIRLVGAALQDGGELICRLVAQEVSAELHFGQYAPRDGERDLHRAAGKAPAPAESRQGRAPQIPFARSEFFPGDAVDLGLLGLVEAVFAVRRGQDVLQGGLYLVQAGKLGQEVLEVGHPCVDGCNTGRLGAAPAGIFAAGYG